MRRGVGASVTLVMVAALAGTAGCGQVERVDKAGGPDSPVTVIRLEMPVSGDPDGLFFAQEVTARSGGSLKVVVDSATYDSRLPSNEARLVAAMRAGQVGFSYEPAHDWAAAGVATMQALDAPFLITTVQASEAFAHSGLVSGVVAGLSRVGMVGVGLIPNEPRHFLSTRPLFTAADFHGLRVRIVDNPQTAALVSALGGVAVQGASADETGVLLRSGGVGGVETSSAYIVSNSYNAEAPYLTSFAAISRFDTIAATKKAWSALSKAQQAALRLAAADTVTHAAQVPVTESAELVELCKAGLVVDEPSPAQLASLVAAAQPAVAVSGQAGLIGTIRSQVPGSGPMLTDLAPPAGCRVAHTAAQATALHNSAANPPTASAQATTIPPGVYVTTDSVTDFRAVGQVGSDWNKPITFSTTLYANGKVFATQDPNYPDQGVGTGTYRVHGDEVTFYWDAYTGLTPETLQWNYFDGQLTFKIIDVQDVAGHAIYTAHPWRKAS